MTIEMSFTVQRVVSASNPLEQTIEAVQDEAGWANPDYRACRLTLVCINDDALKAWGPGKQVVVKFEV